LTVRWPVVAVMVVAVHQLALRWMLFWDPLLMLPVEVAVMVVAVRQLALRWMLFWGPLLMLLVEVLLHQLQLIHWMRPFKPQKAVCWVLLPKVCPPTVVATC
jgi:hypothetical protein